MKRIFACLAVLTLLFGIPASAGTVDESGDVKIITVETDGVLETVTQTRFVEKTLGVSFWYESEYLMVYDTQVEDEAFGTVIVNPLDPANDQPVFLEIMSVSSLNMTAEEFLANVPASFSLDDCGEVEEAVMDTGEYYRYTAGYKGDVYYEFYTVTGSAVDLCIIMSCPMGAIETYGARLDRLIWSLAFESAE